MIAALKLLSILINNVTNSYRPVEDVHISRITHVVNLGKNSCLVLIRDEIKKRCDLISSLRSSVNGRGRFEKIQIEFGLSNQLQTLAVKTRWS